MHYEGRKRLKIYKTLKIPIQGNEEKLDELHSCLFSF
jgi:hypothetical protein